MFFHFLFLTRSAHPFSFWTSLFIKKPYAFMFILSLCSNILTLESIFEYMRQNIKKTCSFQRKRAIRIFV